MTTITPAEFWELMAYSYRRLAYEAHMKHFVPMRGAFWSKSVKERYRLIDEAVKEMAREYLNGQIVPYKDSIGTIDEAKK